MKAFIALFGAACISTVSYSKGKYINNILKIHPTHILADTRPLPQTSTPTHAHLRIPHTPAHTSTHPLTPAHTHVHVCIPTHTHTHPPMYMYVHLHTPAHTCAHLRTPVFTRAHPHKPAHTHTNPHTPVHTCEDPHTPHKYPLMPANALNLINHMKLK